MKNTWNEIKDRTFGTEIEIEEITREEATATIANVIGGQIARIGGAYDAWKVTAPDGRIWKIVRDGSLAHRSAEIVTPILTLADMDTLQEVIRALRRAGAVATERCGAHVHIGASDLTARQLANLVKIFYRQEKLICKALGVYEERLENYTAPIDQDFIRRIEFRKIETMEDLNKAWFGRLNLHPAHYDEHRYHDLNLNNLWNSKHTVEFRIFNGTLHAGEVKANILLALTLTNMAKKARAASSKTQRTYTEETSKYDTRCFLLRLGMIGDEFKTARLNLLKRLGGSTAWKGERRD